MSDNHHSSLLRGVIVPASERKPGIFDLLEMADDWRFSNEFLGQVLRFRRGFIREEIAPPLLSSHDPYWNIEVCTQCGGSGQEPSGVEYYGQQEMVGCEACYGIGYTNERIREVLEGWS